MQYGFSCGYIHFAPVSRLVMQHLQGFVDNLRTLCIRKQVAAAVGSGSTQKENDCQAATLFFKSHS
jgi:hypothetical protein